MKKVLLLIGMSIVLGYLVYGEEIAMTDGPYVFYDDNGEKYQVGTEMIFNQLVRYEKPLSDQQNEICWPNGIFSSITLHPIFDSNDFYQEKDSLLILGDQHGVKDNFLQLLYHHGVVDSTYHWQWGSGHLVFLGDLFDRGDEVTEILWYVYRLEEEARRAGGQVHFVLGNHELMILQGDLRYLNPKYETTAKILQIPYDSLFHKQTELGKWLRSKKAVEKIGRNLLVHAGISLEMIDHFDTLEDINRSLQQFWEKDQSEWSKKDSLLVGSYGPFWFRGFFQEHSRGKYQQLSDEQIGKICEHFDVDRIIVGHTCLGAVKQHFDGKVVSTDVSWNLAYEYTFSSEQVGTKTREDGEGQAEGILSQHGVGYRIWENGQREKLWENP